MIDTWLDELVESMAAYDESILDIQCSTITQAELESYPRDEPVKFFVWSKTRVYVSNVSKNIVESYPLAPIAIATVPFNS